MGAAYQYPCRSCGTVAKVKRETTPWGDERITIHCAFLECGVLPRVAANSDAESLRMWNLSQRPDGMKAGSAANEEGAN